MTAARFLVSATRSRTGLPDASMRVRSADLAHRLWVHMIGEGYGTVTKLAISEVGL